MALYEDIAPYVERHYWDMSYEEMAEELDCGTSTISRASDYLGLPRKCKKHEVEYNHGVDIDRVLYHLHHDALMSVNEMSDALEVARSTLDDWFSDTDVRQRGASEAEKVKWQQMTETERREQVKAAHQKTRELYENGEGSLQVWWGDHPERAQEHVEKIADLGTEAREQNGMAGVTGQEHPSWRGGKSIYDAVKKQLHGPSWSQIRGRHRGERCRKCGEVDTKLDLHHIVPLMSGGTNEPWNLMTLCESCHIEVEWCTRDLLDPVLVE